LFDERKCLAGSVFPLTTAFHAVERPIAPLTDI
jgi:hypothetical protein